MPCLIAYGYAYMHQSIMHISPEQPLLTIFSTVSCSRCCTFSGIAFTFTAMLSRIISLRDLPKISVCQSFCGSFSNVYIRYAMNASLCSSVPTSGATSDAISTFIMCRPLALALSRTPKRLPWRTISGSSSIISSSSGGTMP